MADKTHRFQATIYRIWMMRHVDVPDDVARQLQKQMRGANAGRQGAQMKQSRVGRRAGPTDRAQLCARPGASAGQAQPQPIQRGKSSGRESNARRPKYIPVVAIVNGKLARTTLVPAGGGRFRMQINTTLRKAARADTGDLVGVELRLDRESRELPLPADLHSALKAHPRAWTAFQNLAPGHRRQVIKYFDSAKSTAARSRRLARMVDFLLERALLGGTRKSPSNKTQPAKPRRAAL